MSLPDVASPPAALSRFALVGYFPAYAALLYVLVLVWAHHGGTLSFHRAWHTAANLSVAEVLLIAVAIMLIALVLQPFQLALIRFLEGGRPRWLGVAWSTRRRRTTMRKLLASAEPGDTRPADAAAVREFGLAGITLRRRFPVLEQLVRPTRLGNALAAMEDIAGRDYGLDAVVAWPRLYPLLSPAVKAIVDDRRNSLDLAGRLSATALAAAGATVAICWDTGWWLLLTLAPLALSVVAYAGAVQAAYAYGEAVRVAFDLNRFELAKALRIALPTDPRAEHVLHVALCGLWRQSIPPQVTYVEGEPADAGQ